MNVDQCQIAQKPLDDFVDWVLDESGISGEFNSALEPACDYYIKQLTDADSIKVIRDFESWALSAGVEGKLCGEIDHVVYSYLDTLTTNCVIERIKN